MSTTTVTLDKAGSVVIPKAVSNELHLRPGDVLEVQCEREGVTLRPIRSTSPLRKKDRVLLFRGGNKIPASLTDKLARDLRDQRDRGNLSSR